MEKGLGKVRWGFIGAGHIAKLALYPALLNSKDGEIYAVGAKDRERGLALSPRFGLYRLQRAPCRSKGRGDLCLASKFSPY